MVRWNDQCMYDGIENCAWKHIPVTYILTTNDMTVPLDYQKSMIAMIEEAGHKAKTHQLETGHCPNFAATNEVVDIVNEVVG